jgi:DNA polymerase delta subunit 2
VKDFCFPGLSLKPLIQIQNSSIKDHDKLLLFLSGLDLVNQVDSLALELLGDWIIGSLGNEYIQEEAANIVRVIIAGEIS